MTSDLRRTDRIWVIVALTVCLCPAAWAQPDSIDLSASPPAILADGHSSTVITARVFDRSGGYVADGTEVEFTASLGTIESSAQTVRGLARVGLISSRDEGTSIVVATAQTATATLSVEFARELQGAYEIPEFITADAAYLAYSIDYDVLDCLDGVGLKSGPITINAQAAQLYSATGQLVASGDVSVTSGKSQLCGESLTFSFTTGEGMIFDPVSGSQVRFKAPDLEPVGTEEEAPPPERPRFLDLSDSQILLTARRARVFPGKKVQLAKANVYVYGTKVLKLPHYEYMLGGVAAAASQYFGIGPSGLTMAFPYHLSMNPTSKDSLVISRGAHMGWGSYSSRQGWAVGFSHSYDIPTVASGEFDLMDMSRSTWGARWSETRQFSPSFLGYLDFESPNHRDFFGNVSLSRRSSAFSLSLSLSGSKYEGEESSLGSRLHIETSPARFWGGKSEASLAFDINRANEGASPLYRKSQSLFFQTRTRVGSFGVGTALSLNASVGKVWGGAQVRGTAVQVGLGLHHGFGKKVRLRADYSYSKLPWLGDQELSRQVSAVLSISGLGNLDGHAYYLWNTETGRRSLFAGASYRFSSLWSVSFDLTRQKLGLTSFIDYEIGIGRDIGLARELRLVWSKSRRKFYLEFAGGAF
jgi:hypothetical protein